MNTIRIAFILMCGLLSCTDPARAADPPAKRVAVARYVTATGLLSRREAEPGPWHVVREGEVINSGDLLLGLPGAAVVSSDGAVKLTFHSDLSGTSPLPIIETALTLQEPKGADLDFTLDRGRISMSNEKKQGKAVIHGREQNRSGGELTLLEPGAAASLEIYSRWPAGVKFAKTPGAGGAPTLSLVFLVLKGHVDLKLDTRHFAMHAPPGPALIEADSVHGGDITPQKLDRLPGWATETDNPEAVKRKQAVRDELRKLVAEKSLDAAIDTFISSDDPDKRRLAVFALGATDNLQRLGDVLTSTKHPDVLDNGIIALRHWAGRNATQDQKLYQALLKDKNFTPVDAETTMQLLHSFSEADRHDPHLYDALIDYLEHKKLAIRSLAYWHLRRLVPEGEKIGYNPVAPKESRDQAAAAWHKLIPSGTLPPRLRPTKP